MHHANLCRETQRARRLAIEQLRNKRKAAVRKLEETFAGEKAEAMAVDFKRCVRATPRPRRRSCRRPRFVLLPRGLRAAG